MKKIMAALGVMALVGTTSALALPPTTFDEALTQAGTDISGKLVLVGIAALALLALALGWSLAMKWIGKAARQG